ncbi:MAG: carboxypeptidase-like regulatory domain-containing protein [Planctomycetota bacterium]|nr:carboxypeptidase-like regulatory domain-containing protein [Planctomycetota bacterium]
MNLRVLSVGSALAALLVLLSLGLFRPDRPGGAQALESTGSQAVRPTSEVPPELTQPVETREPRAALAREESKPNQVRNARTFIDEEDEDPGTGVVVGQILDSDGARFEQGQVLVFRDGQFESPLKALELGGEHMGFQVELVAGQSYRLMADPESLPGDHIPAPAHYRKTAREASRYAMAFVHVERDQEHRQNVRVGLPGILAGRVVDRQGQPIVGSLARLTGLDKHFVGLSSSAITDEEGAFRLEGVFPGEHRLTFTWNQEWTPPMPMDLQILGGGERWLGDVVAGGGSHSIRGRILDQDGKPFPDLPVLCYSDAAVKDGLPSHNMSSALARTKTGKDGVFHLTGLPGIPVQVSLTPGFEPRKVGGIGHPAMWVDNLSVDLGIGQSNHDVGSHQVDESRPFEITGRLIFQPGWLSEKGNARAQLTAYVSRVPGMELPEGIRRTTLRRKPVAIDWEEGTYRCLIETPNTGVRLRFELPGEQDLVIVTQPRPFETELHDIRIPEDF